MNIKSFVIGFTTMDSIIAGVSAAKRSVVNVTKSPVHGAQDAAQVIKTGVRSTSEVVTSFLAGAKQAIEYHRGACRALTHDVRSNEE